VPVVRRAAAGPRSVGFRIFSAAGRWEGGEVLLNGPLELKWAPGAQMGPWSSDVPLELKWAPGAKMGPWSSDVPLELKCAPGAQMGPWS
jgi:hypothetical protein